ncbi:MAG: mobilization protein [Proteiniphilum sp.]|jgi:hypothetical protein|uniref:mobilization protein n=1 Tax=Proteiniphilum sp. TaxID=1926877 RepID=UPI002B1EFE33|nr:mobilization protein [Proteiniphilum sp.]MEA5128317.1 mobilization protein [Proteiniphilum sp.]
MKSKHLEYIIIYLSVVIGCIAIAVLVRIAAIEIGVDEFTANIVFWIVIGLGIIIYCILTLIIQGLLEKTSQLFFLKSKKPKGQGDIVRSLSLDEIRSEKKKQIDQQKNQKLNIAILYTRKTFALYTSDTDMNLLCRYIGMYSEGTFFEKVAIQPIRVKEFTPIDIYHFGWNIWNFFKPRNQVEIAHFLKNIFPDILRDVQVESIKKHLKDDELRGIIKIQDNLK